MSSEVFDSNIKIENDKVEPKLFNADEEEISRLEKDANVTQKQSEDDNAPTIDFKCELCDMRQMVHYFGKTPPFVAGISFVEETFIMRDPFQPPPPRWKYKPENFVAIGANCFECNLPICKDPECSFFYTKTYCLKCAKVKQTSFPSEVQSKLKKLISK